VTTNNTMSIVSDDEFALVRDDFYAVDDALRQANDLVKTLERRRQHLRARMTTYYDQHKGDE